MTDNSRCEQIHRPSQTRGQLKTNPHPYLQRHTEELVNDSPTGPIPPIRCLTPDVILSVRSLSGLCSEATCSPCSQHSGIMCFTCLLVLQLLLQRKRGVLMQQQIDHVAEAVPGGLKCCLNPQPLSVVCHHHSRKTTALPSPPFIHSPTTTALPSQPYQHSPSGSTNNFLDPLAHLLNFTRSYQ